ncbi:MAG TPA: alpha/beta hydrolase [Pseudomonas sp.]|nr:alpha/beta hydrolase [Pseudomonas sp.]
MKQPLLKTLVAALALSAASAFAAAEKPTVVLVHGAFADASSWNGVAKILQHDGYTVIAAANPLRSVQSDGAAVAALVQGIQTPVVLVGHSYGGSVISAAANGQANVKALVYVAAFAPDAGEAAADLAGKFPGSSLGPTLAAPVPLADGGKDLYIQQDKFHQQFAADVPAEQAALMAATQRPVTDAALHEKAGTPAWKNLPSWHIYGDRDLNIPPQAMAFMAKRANAQAVEVVKGASHVVMVSNPEPVARLIEQAAGAK